MRPLTPGRAAIALAVLAGGVGLAAALPASPAAAQTIVPVQAGWRCPDLAAQGGTGPWEGLYVSEPPAPGTTATYTEGSVSITVTTAADGNSVTWSSNTPQDAVFVNAGEPPLTPNASAVWVYDPPGPESTGGVVAGIGSATRVDHLRFCWDIEQATTTPTTAPTTTPATGPTVPTTPSPPVTPAGSQPVPPTSNAADSPTTSGSRATLPATGSGGSSGTVALGAVAALTGAALVLAGRRRHVSS
jgi:LPXTG-motif cell wall-anchored protein